MFTKCFERRFPEEERSFYRWKSDYYEVSINKYDSGLVILYVNPKGGDGQPKYLPEMYVYGKNDFLPELVVIQTTSYGALSLEEIRSMQEALTIAVEEGETIHEQFIDPIRAGTFQY